MRTIITFQIGASMLETISFRCSLEARLRNSARICAFPLAAMLISNQSVANNKGDPSDCYYVRARELLTDEIASHVAVI